ESTLTRSKFVNVLSTKAGQCQQHRPILMPKYSGWRCLKKYDLPSKLAVRIGTSLTIPGREAAAEWRRGGNSTGDPHAEPPASQGDGTKGITYCLSAASLFDLTVCVGHIFWDLFAANRTPVSAAPAPAEKNETSSHGRIARNRQRVSRGKPREPGPTRSGPGGPRTGSLLPRTS